MPLYYNMFFRKWFCLVGIIVGLTGSLSAQNINGEKIEVSREALTVLRFNSEIKRYELGDRKSYTCQVRDYDNSIVIKTISDDPAESTNLLVTEGKRTHYFIVTFLPRIDINKVKLFYDYSDLKALRRFVSSSNELLAKEMKAAEKEDSKEVRRKEKELERELEEERKKKAELESQRKLAQEREAEKERLQKEQETVKKEEQKRILEEKRKEEEERLTKMEQERQEKLKREQERIEKEKERQLQLALAKEQERKKKALEEELRIQKINDEQQIRLAQQREAARIAAEKKKREAEEQERKRAEAENEKKLAALREKERKEDERLRKLAQQEEDKRLKEEEKKKQEENKTEYTHTELWKKYPNIVFGDPPEGQRMTGEYYLASDTAENYRVCMQLQAMPPWLNLTSDTVNGISLSLQSMIFSGANCYMRFVIRNRSKDDLLVGMQNLEWNKGDKGTTDLFPCYVNGYPVILPGKDFTLFYVSRAVNAADQDQFIFSLQDRFKKTKLKVRFTGAEYNLEMSR